MAVLKKKRNSAGMDASGLTSFLGKEKDEVEEKSGGIVGKLLDQDGDDDFDVGDFGKLAAEKLFG